MAVRSGIFFFRACEFPHCIGEEGGRVLYSDVPVDVIFEDQRRLEIEEDDVFYYVEEGEPVPGLASTLGVGDIF